MVFPTSFDENMIERKACRSLERLERPALWLAALRRGESVAQYASNRGIKQ
ncbi:Unknown protein sequence [Pseudomonas amygdali pv. ulmi]|uniref:Uncharacterized protein n=1 Tax=Pseudomonas amygdali pv. ulmi TaxID=251720 RepID=A0A0Q0C6N7_PSEA0|nr:Unknown protein sequence [Pseudomonas amygdali pv. ulmi]RMR14200.1 hypothetical protein ALP90_03492 [Pseudomonas amygdali pv. ulmi]